LAKDGDEAQGKGPLVEAQRAGLLVLDQGEGETTGDGDDGHGESRPGPHGIRRYTWFLECGGESSVVHFH